MSSSRVSSNSSDKYKFVADEKVLCYEPDPTKAKVLYDAKVLEVVCRKDTRGRKSYEYLIHFQGWNSSWDRYVAEEYVLKDTAENRELQQFLNEEAQQLQQNLKKKKKRPLAEASKNIRQDRRRCNSVPTPERDIEESSKSSFSDGDGLEESSDDDSDDEVVCNQNGHEEKKKGTPCMVPFNLKSILESDLHLVTQRRRLLKLPASTNVTKVLEDYVKEFGLKELLDWAERVRLESTSPPPQPTVTVAQTSPPVTTTTKTKAKTTAAAPSKAPAVAKPEESTGDELKAVIRRINFMKEIVDGLRLMFDFLIETCLLYEEEVKQCARTKCFTRLPVNNKPPESLKDFIRKCNLEFQDLLDIDGCIDLDYKDDPPPAKRMTRTAKVTCKLEAQEETTTEPESSPRGRVSSTDSGVNITIKREHRSPSPDSKRRAREYIQELLNWKLVPPDVQSLNPPNPSLVYGLIHLCRLFVKMPEILSKGIIPKRRLKCLVDQINNLLTYVVKYQFNVDELYYKTSDEELAYEEQWSS